MHGQSAWQNSPCSHQLTSFRCAHMPLIVLLAVELYAVVVAGRRKQLCMSVMCTGAATGTSIWGCQATRFTSCVWLWMMDSQSYSSVSSSTAAVRWALVGYVEPAQTQTDLSRDAVASSAPDADQATLFSSCCWPSSVAMRSYPVCAE